MSESDVVIRVEGLGKKYSLHHEQSERYTALRDVVARQAKAAGRLLNPFTLAGQLRKAQRQAAQEHAASEEEFWALKDVSFEIRRGERVGIIGRNGAGKSTLLKILSRITEPTTGRVEIRGRVASLLEVGTGFHPELTGRENIYLNGAILGMTRREIRAKFDEIVDFAEVEKFLDTPVKRYSSGMYVRLAFAVAAHLEPEILVVDEVLAVGDAEFQSKCFKKIEGNNENANQTILFVSHNTDALKRLCNQGCLIEKGHFRHFGSIAKSLAIYRGGSAASTDFRANDEKEILPMAVKQAHAFQPSRNSGEPFRDDEAFFIEIRGHNLEANPSVGIKIWDSEGNCAGHFLSEVSHQWIKIPRGEFTLICGIPGYTLKQGTYWVDIYCSTPFVKTYCHHQSALSFTISSSHKILSSYGTESISSTVSPLLAHWKSR
jgi:lipopolysaccharide transport system ATP-binding protein